MALAQPHPPGGAAARCENAILLATGATAPPRPSSAAPLFRHAHMPRTRARWPWRVRAVCLATFGRSYEVAWRRRTPLPARPHASRTRAMALARPCGELGHIRPKLPSSMAPLRPPLGAPARPAHLRNGLGASAP
ncbi:hypothetical protein PIB30_084872 [Stylosanthes scabra]|uniref:Uncharacterized protein n=1 Tax=Stylosanthes scabra TaxID=79078 RepID=A0ABU6UTF3_9FABA|nr:hypothetical protein [Stylosanthes scabra]